jgi:hypothetical protein
MYGFTIVGTTGDRNFPFTEPKTVRRSRKNHRESLKWFSRRAQVSDRLRRAQGTDPPAASVDGNQVPAMSGFDYRTAPDLDQVSTSAVFRLMKRHETSILTGGKEKRKAGKTIHEATRKVAKHHRFVFATVTSWIAMRFQGLRFESVTNSAGSGLFDQALLLFLC